MAIAALLYALASVISVMIQWSHWRRHASPQRQFTRAVASSGKDGHQGDGVKHAWLCQEKWETREISGFKYRKAAMRDINSACMLGGSVVSDSLRPLFVTLADDSPPCSSVHGIFQARILEWVAVSFSRGSSRPREGIRVSCSSCVGRWVLHHWVTWEAPAQVEQGLIGKLHVTEQGICTLPYRQGMFS